MNDFNLYFNTGWQHIISTGAADHILFIITLSAIYLLKNWKQVLILITAFTLGHSLTLALSVLDIFRINAAWVEFLIPCTIIATAIFNLFQKSFDNKSLRINYFLALFFGLIHGMGFANAIRFMLAKDQQIAIPLISFNIGLEIGQICVVAVILLMSYLIVNIWLLKRKWWVMGLSIVSLLIAIWFALKRIPYMN